MKKNLIALVILNVAALAGLSGVMAQPITTGNTMASKNSIMEFSKTTSPAGSSKIEMEIINHKALKNFSNQYKQVRNVSWEKLRNGFFARFVSDDIRATIYYDNKGNWLGSIKYYGEEKLAHEIRQIVKSTYYDYNIIGIQEVVTVDSPDVPTYIITMEDRKHVKLLRICNREMEVWKEMNKTF
ncbi:MAG TPA: hypothetical protein VF487_08895 [Chitinophagaceae bacterium]